ncbi:MAG: deoxyhypusine synthase, partial [Candidatus Hydrogenedentes bacterium CG07_land_8_20_14_0_80_42_17]
MSIKNFMKQNFKHFNSVLLVEAAEAYSLHLKKGGKMFMTLGGAMSTAELGISLAEMIRQNKVNAICSTGANLEE